jgi:hypothetical protein
MALVPPCASTMRFTMARPRPVPFALVVWKGSKACRRCSGLKPEPLSRTVTRSAGRSPSNASRQTMTTRTGSGLASKALAKRLANTCRSRNRSASHASWGECGGGPRPPTLPPPAQIFLQPDVPAGILDKHLRPGLAPDVSQVAGTDVEHDGAGVATDVVEEALEVVERLPRPPGQVHLLGLAFQPEAQPG